MSERLIAAAISRFSWLMDAYRLGLATGPDVQVGMTYTVEEGRSRSEPSLLGASAHLLAIATKPATAS